MTKQTNNMLIWDNVSKSDITSLKDAKLNGQDIKSINTTSVFMELTKQFGPFGQGWGYSILKDEFIDGVPVLNSAGGVICNEQMHTIQIALWYMSDDKKIECPPQYGHTPFIMKTSYGPKTDFDAPKKSLSDAIKKSSSMLGFNADVFLGEWDDVSEAEMQAEKQAVKTEKREEKDAKQFDDLCDEVKKALEETLPGIKSKRSLETFKNKFLRKCANEQGLLNRVIAAVKARHDEIDAAKAAAQTDNQEGDNND